MQYLTLRLLATLSFLATCSLSADLPLSPDSERRPGVPPGKIEKFTWTSRVFPGTVRDYWVYVPAQYKPDTPAAVMVFQDGGGFVNDKGRFRVPIVFDNLIHAGDMPVTIAILINPGTLPALDSAAKPRDNRSYEYDSLGDRYARFLIEEILPEVGKRWNLTLDPNLRALAGNSSGGICSFNVAWERPDQFRRVLSTIGSFTDLRGGDIYPSLVRKMEPKPIRVYLQDNDSPGGSPGEGHLRELRSQLLDRGPVLGAVSDDEVVALRGVLADDARRVRHDILVRPTEIVRFSDFFRLWRALYIDWVKARSLVTLGATSR